MESESNFRYIYIWTEWIVPLVNDIYIQSDPQFRKYCNVRIRDLDRICSDAEKYYQRKREEVKRAFYGEYHRGDSEIQHRMDFPVHVIRKYNFSRFI